MYKIDDQQELDELLPWPNPGQRAMTDAELEVIRLRLGILKQEPTIAAASACHVPEPSDCYLRSGGATLP